MNGLSSVNSSCQNNAHYYLNAQNSAMPQTYEPDESEKTAKTVATAGILQAFALFLHKASEWCGKKLMQGEEFTSSNDIIKIADSMVKKNKLNVTVDYIDEKNIHKYSSNMHDMLKPVARGENAFYSDGLKLAVAPKSKPSLILHELGHAINAHKGKFLRFLQKSRGYVSAVPTAIVMLKGLFVRNGDNKPNFVEKHAGLIGFTAFLPTIIEEGLASIRGVKSAKNVLGKTANLAPLKRNYFFAWLTYVIAGIGLGVAAKQAILSDKK